MTHSTAPLVLSTREPHPITPAPVPDRIERYRSETELDIDLAEQIATSDMLPGAYKGKAPATVKANLIMTFALGRALGVERIAALYGFDVIENRPQPSAVLQASLVRRAGHRLRVIERTSERAVCEITRHDDPDYPCRVEYTLDDARRAGSLDIYLDRWIKNSEGRNKREAWTFPTGMTIDATAEELQAAGAPEWVVKAPKGDRKRKDIYHSRPRVMLWHRAITECVGAACPEVLAGLDFTGVDLSPIVETTTADPLDVLRARPEEPEPEDIADAELVDDHIPASARVTRSFDIGDEPEPVAEERPRGPIAEALDGLADRVLANANLLGEPDPHAGFPPDAPKVDEAELKAAMKAAGVTQAEVMRQFEAKSLGALLSPDVVDGVMKWLEGDR